MALIFADPVGKFYATVTQMQQGTGWNSVNAGVTLVTSGLPAGAVETTALNPGGINPWGNINLATAGSLSGPFTYGCRCYISNLGSNNIFGIYNSGASIQGSFQTTASGALQYLRGNATVLGVSAPAIVKANTWNYFELRAFCNNTTGFFTIRLNNSVVLSLTGQNTQNQGDTTFNIIAFGNPMTYIQDIYITDDVTTNPNNIVTGFLGDVSMPVLYANRNGTFTQYAPTGAAQLWQCVQDPTPDDATTFVSDSTPGDRVSFGYASAASSNPVLGVMHYSRCLKSDTGTRTLSQTLTSNGTDVIAPAVAPGTSYSYFLQGSSLDPNTGLPYTLNALNALQGGIKTVT